MRRSSTRSCRGKGFSITSIRAQILAKSKAYVQRLRAAEALVLVFPVWFDGLPAIMQGYFQRVFLPGVAIRIDEAGLFHPNLHHIKRMAAVCAYGEGRRDVSAKGDPPLRFVRDNIGALIDPKGRFEYLALYDMNFSATSQAEPHSSSASPARSRPGEQVEERLGSETIFGPSKRPVHP